MTAILACLVVLLADVGPAGVAGIADWGAAVRDIREACERFRAAAERVERAAAHAERFTNDAGAAAASVRAAADGFRPAHMAFAYAAGLSLGIVGSEVGKYAVRRAESLIRGVPPDA